MSNSPYNSGLTDPDRGDQGVFAAPDRDTDYGQPVPEQAYPEQTYTAPVEPTYTEPVTADPWADSSDLSTAGSTTGVAKDEAANVAGTAAGEGKAVAGTAVEEGKAVAGTAVEAGINVAGTAKTEAVNVATEIGQQAKNLLSTATSELQSQAGTQQGRLASTLRTYSDELKGLADGTSPEPGVVTDLIKQASSKGTEVVQWLEDREPADVLADVRRFAARRPVTFLALCGLAGVVAGRITRGAVAANTSVEPARALETESSYTTTPNYTVAPSYTAAPEYPAAPAYSTTPGYVGGTSNGGYSETVPGPDYTAGTTR